MQLTRESISRAALAILDEYGLADVTMRRVASSLGVAPGALYWHIENKQDLIYAVAEIICAPVLSADAEPGDTPGEVCAALSAALLAHRDGAEVVSSAMSQPASPLTAGISALLRAAVAREVEAAGAEASISAQHAAADGLLYLTLGAVTVRQLTAQFAEATHAPSAPPGSGSSDIGTAADFLIAGLLASTP
ncbi:TetR/AcrR family transcriptional regulator [Corynebacterium liangguodongii]|uniref:TetR family transcriptional regulator n=1 Tax=Corynebacterium liangguodongii TaxID=2079535 RepID=A0A2S0WEX2_9CORY|nr:TetR family transcriptional regulator [Corynebacterium liangguodongii]AWB84321.1 TetR family transcriptional regulator [Corynebacterium liangguodongii]PWB99811.1 TetR family transcriptional regulator [Corynebacterium liangguodongii]